MNAQRRSRSSVSLRRTPEGTPQSPSPLRPCWIVHLSILRKVAGDCLRCGRRLQPRWMTILSSLFAYRHLDNFQAAVQPVYHSVLSSPSP
jgi:hypothetical protein